VKLSLSLLLSLSLYPPLSLQVSRLAVITKYLLNKILNEIQETYKQRHYVANSLKKGHVVPTFHEQVVLAAMQEVQEVD
jgi:hypothetical protein